MTWRINEWYGVDVATMSPSQRAEAAQAALEISDKPRPQCPFAQRLMPGQECHKKGGVCSIIDSVDPSQPATVCPTRFLADVDGESVFTYIARELFGVDSGAAVIREVPFLTKIDREGNPRSAKAGRIDWVLIPKPDSDDIRDWIAIETQAVYFSGSKMQGDFEAALENPTDIPGPSGHRRPDWRSSGAKRLAPQLDAKSPVMMRWGKKVVVIVDAAFFAELAAFTSPSSSFANSEIVWLVVKYKDDMGLTLDSVVFAELADSVQALQATRPLEPVTFEADLMRNLRKKHNPKVHRL